MFLQSHTPHVEAPMTNTPSTLGDPLAQFPMMPSELACILVQLDQKVERAIPF